MQFSLLLVTSTMLVYNDTMVLKLTSVCIIDPVRKFSKLDFKIVTCSPCLPICCSVFVNVSFLVFSPHIHFDSFSIGCLRVA